MKKVTKNYAIGPYQGAARLLSHIIGKVRPRLFWVVIILISSATPRLSHAYTIVAAPGWTEGSYWGNCTVNYCAISSFAPSGDGNCPICGTPSFWNSTTLPKGHYYFLGSISFLECVAGKWVSVRSTPGWFFNYDPRSGDQSAIAGGECGASTPTNIPNADPGKPECNDQIL